MKKIISMMATAAVLASCTGNAPKALILYYSQTGTTEAVAAELQKQTGADIEKFDVEEVYDGDFNATIQRCMGERAEGFVPTLKPIAADLSQYDVIFLGYPIWFGTYAPPVKAFLNTVSAELNGKKIVPFCTFGSGGLTSGIADLKAALPGTEIAEGYGVRAARVQYAAEELDRFLIENGYKEGSVEPLPEYSEQAVPTEEETAIFDEATSGYAFPLGTPVTAGSRTVAGGTDYLFIVNSMDQAGNPVEGKIYVICREGRKAEFTQVVR